MSHRLTVEHLAWTVAGHQVLTDVSFTVRSGEVAAIMGRNGAGKSTVLDIIAGLRSPTAGSVSFDGRRAAEWTGRERARLVAHLPQLVRPDLPFLAGELVLMGRYPHTDAWFESDSDRAVVQRVMRQTGCWELRDRILMTLSGGERQRVLLAACLAQDAGIVLFDEPSSFLDIDQQLHCFALIRDESLRGAACLAVTHDLNLALAYATRLIVIDGGRVALDLPVEEAAQSSDWLSLFSPRLMFVTGDSGRPWVAYR
jgi:iron complex transport system ATP-binding protein